MQPNLKENYLYRMLHEILLFAIPMITLPYVSRVLGADGIGDYSYTYSVITYFMLFGALGTASYGVREIARKRDEKEACTKLFWQIEGMSVITCLISLLVWGLLIFFDGSHRMLFAALTPFLLGTMFDISWFYTGLERLKQIVLSGALVRIAGVVLIFVLIRSKEDVVIYCAVNAAVLLAANLSMWLFLPKHLVKIKWEGLDLLHHLHETCVYFIPTVATSIYLVLDKTLIGLITGDPNQNGYYEQASRMIGIAKSLAFVVLNSVATARLSYLYETKQTDGARKVLHGSMDFIFLMCYGAAFGLLGVSHTLVPVFFGDGYAPVEYLIYFMLPLIPVIGISNCLGDQYYTPVGKRAQSAAYIVAGAVLNLILNLCLIPFMKAEGAVIASLAAELLITVLFLKNCEGILRMGQIFAYSYKRVIAGLLMAVIVRLLGNLPGNRIVILCVQVLSGALLYLLLLLLLRDGPVLASFQKYILHQGNYEDKE